jgi:hypothetical protein
MNPPSPRLPRVGDIVLYGETHGNQRADLAAIVTAVEEPTNARSPVDLAVFRSGLGGSDPLQSVLHSDHPSPGTWYWRD